MQYNDVNSSGEDFCKVLADLLSFGFIVEFKKMFFLSKAKGHCLIS